MHSYVRRAALMLPILLATAGCQAAVPSDDVLLLTPALPETLNPLAGFDNNGTGKINESLYTLDGETGSLPNLVPLLAEGEPQISADGLRWSIALQPGISFSDGSGFDAGDVAASYRAILDPASASPIAGVLENLDTVRAVDEHTVEFTLKEPQVSFKTALLIGIAPEELIADGPVSNSSLNRTPVGTGPYTVQKIDSAQLVLGANPDYRSGAPDVARVVYEQSADDNARSQALAGGGYTGTVLPPRLAASFADRDGFEVVTATSADWRGISLPADHPFTADPSVRLALNLLVDRQALIDGVLAGSGRPAYTFVPAQYGKAYNSDAVFAHDPQRAEQLLEQSGWTLDGSMRSKDGQDAAFTIMYNAGDTLRRDLSLALAAQLKEHGITAEVVPATFDEAEPRIGTDALMLGGGDTPYDVDTQLYKMLHSSYPEDGAYYDNPSRYADAAMDRLLHIGRTSTDPTARDQAYRKVQELYVKQPSMLLLAFTDHNYVQRSDVHETWNTAGTLLEPHDHGTAWGPWVKIGQWTGK
ncbi:ABC transporter substrate-binding protein [Arthrobacter sp. MYb214]|uniref:ABC transporter substrate-binding protein n=1 Tax=Arthrobacter sp. MYb214 TaxID=1848596 RepID=UPI002570C0CE|nr:ABC transporter substrate-binding protein [Arthrobacter sp. MYb214]